MGTAVLIMKNFELPLNSEFITGYIFALIAAVLWSLYTALSRKYGHVPTHVVGIFCAATAVSSSTCHLLFRTNNLPFFKHLFCRTPFGNFPNRIVIFTWDHGVKHRNIKILNGVFYFTPLLSALLLIAFGSENFSHQVIIAAVLITSGAFLAPLDLFKKI